MSTTEALIISFIAGLTVAVLTAPVGVSGAVFLLPVQLSLLQVPNPAVTATNLLFNIVATPGALARYGRRASLRSPLTLLLVAGGVPGVTVGAAVRVFILPGPNVFRLIVATLLLPLGIWLCLYSPASQPGTTVARTQDVSAKSTIAMAVAVGVVGGIYGIGGGSLLSPILVGRGLPMATVAPAALLNTFVTSLVGAVTFVLLAITQPDLHIAPHWTIGLMAGTGGLVGGYLGAALQPRIPERALRAGLGVVAIAIAVFYAAQVIA